MTIKSNLAWHRTKAVSYFFTKLDGWPQSMTPCQLAALQSPELAKGWRVDKALLLAINESCSAGDESCTAGTLIHETITETHYLIDYEINIFGDKELDEWKAANRRPYVITTVGNVAIIEVAAPDFADWLAAQGETPSEHIQAWFDAVGVAWPPGAPEVALPASGAPEESLLPGVPVPKPRRPGRKPSWETIAKPYLQKLYGEGNYRSATVFYKAVKRRTGELGSPFKIVDHELFCIGAGRVAEGTFKKIWPEIRTE